MLIDAFNLTSLVTNGSKSSQSFIVHLGKVGYNQVYKDTSSWENHFLVSVIIFYLSCFPCSPWTTSTICLFVFTLQSFFFKWYHLSIINQQQLARPTCSAISIIPPSQCMAVLDWGFGQGLVHVLQHLDHTKDLSGTIMTKTTLSISHPYRPPSALWQATQRLSHYHLLSAGPSKKQWGDKYLIIMRVNKS